MAMYVLAQASDWYAVVYSVAELEPAMTDNRILVAHKINGKPLAPKGGPFKVVVPGDSRPRDGFACSPLSGGKRRQSF